MLAYREACGEDVKRSERTVEGIRGHTRAQGAQKATYRALPYATYDVVFFSKPCQQILQNDRRTPP